MTELTEPPAEAELRRAFEAAPAYTVGLEDEVMVLDPRTFALVPKAREVLSATGGDPRFKLELPASQVEIMTQPQRTVAAAADELLAGRRDLVAAVGGAMLFAGAGAHPFSSGAGALNEGPYEAIVREYGWVAERELVCSLQVHVSAGGSDRALAIYNAARSYLPYLAALAANAPFYEGSDTGLASIRPKLAEQLPRQGVPPAFESWGSFRDALAWGATSGAFVDATRWWWELRPHPGFGTLEFRVPDGQSTIADAAAIAAVAQALVAWLGEQHDAGERLPVHPRWRIEENRWSACRHGVEGEMADLRTGRRATTRDRLFDLLAGIEPTARALGSGALLDRARAMVEVNGAIAQRRAGSAEGAARWLAECFLAQDDG